MTTTAVAAIIRVFAPVACLMGPLCLPAQAQPNGVLREVFTGIPGTSLNDLTGGAGFPDAPTFVEVLTSFRAPVNVDNEYGQRLRALLTPPVTGDYVFWIASDDNGALFLGTDDSPPSKQLIAGVPGWTSEMEWTKYPEQQSAVIPLEAGKRYYLEALMKEGGGGDNLTVRWQLPGGAIENPIPNSRLQVYQIANPDSFTMRHGGKARLRLTANDVGYFSGPVQIITPPTSGIASPADDGSVLYTHTSGEPESDSFTYLLPGWDGESGEPTTVTINFTSAIRFETDYVQLPAQAPATTWQLVDAFPGLQFNSPNGLCSAPGDTEKLFLVESAGRVWLIPDVTAANPVKVLFLNITDRVTSDSYERGAKGVACHPNFAENGYLYVTYNATDTGGVKTRLSRFTRSALDPQQADPSTEVVLINQVLEGPYHDIGSCRFGPDGYLYVAFGDEGGQDEEYENSQRIDKDLYSSIIRIDVDKLGGNLEPNPDPDIPRDGGGLAYFSVPADNPFVGATSFNNQPVNPAQVCTEIYVLGLRNPWQFSFDPGTDRLWVADVQRGAREEISLLGPGENGGWSWREAGIAGPRTGQIINGAAETDATLVDPILEYPHGSGPYQGNSITGGFVYEGTNYPGLAGHYIFGDYVTGSVWSIDPADPAGTFTRLTGGQSIAAFHPDPANEDILLIQWGVEGSNSGRIMRLIYGADDTGFPQTLGETGFFADLTDLTPNPGAHFYEPNLRFWSDHADKTRWFLIRNATDVIGHSEDGQWTFPEGMIWAKHFDLELERGNPATTQRIETRFLIKTADSSYGVSYKWNDEETEAFLVNEAGEEFDPTVTEAGFPRTQRYHIPSRAECLACHSPQAGSALSFNTRQLNRDGSIEGHHGNLLNVLASTGYLTGLTGNPATLPRHVRPDETQFSLEARVRSYLAVNCANCHQAGSATPPSWDGREHLNLWATGLINGVPLAAGSNPEHRLIVPGDLDRSIVWNRIAVMNGYTRMPPIASNERDLAAIDLVTEWIQSTHPDRQDYDAWRLQYFGNLVSPEGEPMANPDGDRHANEVEFLQHTIPTNALSFSLPGIEVSVGVFTLEVPPYPARRVFVETTTELGAGGAWTRWDVPGNDGIPRAPGVGLQLEAPPIDPRRFFRINVLEE